MSNYSIKKHVRKTRIELNLNFGVNLKKDVD